MGTETSIFQAEVFASIKCAEINLEKKLRNQHIYINSDSQAALLALKSFEQTSKLVQTCTETLNALGSTNKVILTWVPGHSNIEGNELADELARKGADTPQIGVEPFCGITKQRATTLLTTLCKEEAMESWMSTSGQEHSKALIRGYNNKVTKELLKFKRYKACAVTRILTGHCKLNKHLFNMSMTENALCRFCNTEEETAMHILCSCGPLMSKRSIHLGRHIMHPDEIVDITLQRIWQFIDSTGLSSEL